MSWWPFKKKTKASKLNNAPSIHVLMKGALIVDIELDGCQATIPKFRRIGRVRAVKKHSEIWGEAHKNPRYPDYYYAMCKEIDVTLSDETYTGEIFYVPIHDRWLKKQFGIYLWRH